ncbi:hypothetical protein [Aeromicrobium sp.]|uniref:hypothetical protein n=1 Tax=Aeromicrobium sp. TaxID=1871063 RepID=UPI0028B04F7E|nr:hypothetical protein [Aeromicrobium sp.]
MDPVPDNLRGRPFTTAQAEAAGVGRRRLYGSGFRSLHPGRGVWCLADEPLTFPLQLAADRLILPPDAAVSHVTGLRIYLPEALGSTPISPRHWSTNTPRKVRSEHVVLHRRQESLWTQEVDAVPILGPDRCLVDAAISLPLADIIRIGDALIKEGLTAAEAFTEFAWSRHLHGVRRSRLSAWRMRARADSFAETDARLVLNVCGLPEPEVNGVIVVPERVEPWHGDLVLRKWKIDVEYDGWHHERSAAQRRVDILRRESLEAAGWLVVVLTADDLRSVTTLVGRVWRALVGRGYEGMPPTYNHVELEELRRDPKPPK